MNNKFLSVILGLTLTIGATAALAATKVTPKAAPVDAKVNEKKLNEFLKFNKENGKLTIDHIEKMRALNIKNINAQFDRMIANQKEIQKASDVALASGSFMTKEQYDQKYQEFSKSQESSQAKFLVFTKSEDDKFQAMMKKRQDEFSKNKK